MQSGGKLPTPPPPGEKGCPRQHKRVLPGLWGSRRESGPPSFLVPRNPQHDNFHREKPVSHSRNSEYLSEIYM